MPKRRKPASQPVDAGRRSAARAPEFLAPDIYFCFALLVLVIGIYLQTGRFQLINYDDVQYISANEHVRSGLNYRNFLWALTSSPDGNWIPLTWISHMLDYQFFGPDAGAQHLVNVFIHGVATILMFLFFRLSTANRWASAFVALIFALHPLHVESVAWVSERKDVLSGAFWFLTLLIYLWYIRKPGVARYALLLLSFGLGLASKPMLVTLPVVVLLLDIWPLRRLLNPDAGRNLPARVFWEKVPLLAMAIADSVVTVFAQGEINAVASISQRPLGDRIANALAAYCAYLEKALWPSHLALPYPYAAIPWWEAAAAACALGAISYAVLVAFRTSPFAAVGWCWFIVTLLPTIGLVQVGTQPWADRYTYIPLVGVSIMVAWGAKSVVETWPRFERWPHRRTAVGVAAAVLSAAMLVVTWIQIGYWSDGERLFQHTLAVTRENGAAHALLAEYYRSQDRGGESVAQSREAVRLLPGAVEPRLDLAAALGMVDRHAESAVEYRNATILRPGNAVAHAGLALELSRTGHIKEALDEYWQSIRLDRSYPASHYDLARLLAQLNRLDEAIAEFSTACALDPDNADYHRGLGIALGTEQRIDESIVEFQTAIRLKSTSADAHFDLGSAFAIEGRLDDAIGQFTEALRLDPNLPGAQQSLDNALALKRASKP